MTKLTVDYFSNNPHALIDVIAALHAVDYPNIKFEDADPDDSYLMRTLFDKKETTIKINFKYVDMPVKFVSSLIHELRHIYQVIVVNNNDYEDVNIIELWKEGFNAYVNSSVNDYEYNILELDANAFTVLIMAMMFDDHSFIPSTLNTNEFKSVYAYLSNSFTLEDVNDSLYVIDQ